MGFLNCNIMRKLFKSIVFVAATAMTLTSCLKNELDGVVKRDLQFYINADLPVTKTVITANGDGTYTPSWTGEEQLGVLFAKPDENTAKENLITFENTAEPGQYASFQGLAQNVGETGTFYSFYPESAFEKGYKEGDVRLDLKRIQKPSADSFDPECDILVAKPYQYTSRDGAVEVENLYFARIMTVLRINLDTEFEDVKNEFVKSLSFTAGDVKLTGYARIFLDNPAFSGKWASSADEYSTVVAQYDNDVVSVAGEKNSVYLIVAPVQIPKDEKLTFEIKTSNYTITKVVEEHDVMQFPAGNIAVINLDIKEIECEKADLSVDYTGEYLIVDTKLEKAASKWTGANNLLAFSLDVKDGVVYETDGLADCKMTITKVTVGDNAGKYTIVDAAGNYLYAAGANSSNHLKGQDDPSYWTIEDNDGKFVIVSTVENCSRNILRYNGTNNPPIFSCYGSGQSDVTLYKYSDIKVDTTPVISLDENEYTVVAEETTVTIPYNLKNITGNITAGVEDGATITGLSTVVGKDDVTVNFEANKTTDVRTATIVLSYEGAESQRVVIIQQSAGVTKQYYVKVTEKPADWSGTYLMVCDTKNMALSSISTTSTNYGIGTSVTISDNKIEATSDNEKWQIVITKASVTSGAYKLKFANSYLYWNSGNSLATNSTESVNTNWNLTLSSGNVTIKNCKDNSRVIWWNASSPRFACYTSSQTAIQLYKLEESNAGGETPEQPEEPAKPVQLEMSDITCSAQTENSLTFNWDEVANASGYLVTFNNETETVNTTQYSATGLTASTSYPISIVAKGDGANYADSEPKTQIGTTSAAEGNPSISGFTLVTNIDDITSGQYVIAAKVGDKYYAMGNNFVSNYISGTLVNVTNNIISEVDAANYVVTITRSGSNITILSGTKYLKYGTSGTNLSTQTTSYNWTITSGTKGTFRIGATTGTNRALVYRTSTYNRFAAYSTGNINGTEYYDLELFKLSN